MADSPAFDRACEELEQKTSLDRLETRGTMRLALKNAGLEARNVDGHQIAVVIRRLLPQELANRGIATSEELCQAIADSVEKIGSDGSADRAGDAAATIDRFGR